MTRPAPGLLPAAAVLLTLACASCTETGPAPGPSTGSTGSPAATAAVTGGFRSGIDRGARVTQLTASSVSTPAPVEMTDGTVHLTYELVLTNVAPAPVRVDTIALQDAAMPAPPRSSRPSRLSRLPTR